MCYLIHLKRALYIFQTQNTLLYIWKHFWGLLSIKNTTFLSNNWTEYIIELNALVFLLICERFPYLHNLSDKIRAHYLELNIFWCTFKLLFIIFNEAFCLNAAAAGAYRTSLISAKDTLNPSFTDGFMKQKAFVYTVSCFIILKTWELFQK